MLTWSSLPCFLLHRSACAKTLANSKSSRCQLNRIMGDQVGRLRIRQSSTECNRISKWLSDDQQPYRGYSEHRLRIYPSHTTHFWPCRSANNQINKRNGLEQAFSEGLAGCSSCARMPTDLTERLTVAAAGHAAIDVTMSRPHTAFCPLVGLSSRAFPPTPVPPLSASSHSLGSLTK